MTKKPKQSADGFNVYETVLTSSLPDVEKSVERIHHEGFQTFAAGTLTTARVLSTGIYFVLADSQLHQHLRQELWDRIPNADDIPDLTVLESLSLLVRG